jgi:hypothetical protein
MQGGRAQVQTVKEVIVLMNVDDVNVVLVVCICVVVGFVVSLSQRLLAGFKKFRAANGWRHGVCCFLFLDTFRCRGELFLLTVDCERHS